MYNNTYNETQKDLYNTAKSTLSCNVSVPIVGKIKRDIWLVMCTEILMITRKESHTASILLLNINININLNNCCSKDMPFFL